MIAKITSVGPPCDPSTIGSSFPFTEPDFPLATQAQIQATGGHPVNGSNICQTSTPPQPLPTFGCTATTAANYDPNADGCETSPGIADPNDYSCCIAPPGGATNFGQSISSLDKFNTDMAFEPKTPSIEPGDPSDDIAKLQKRAGIRKER